MMSRVTSNIYQNKSGLILIDLIGIKYEVVLVALRMCKIKILKS